MKVSSAFYRKFKANRLALWGAIFITVVILLSVFAYLFIPDKTMHASRQHPSLTGQGPGFTMSFFKVPIKDTEPTGFFTSLFVGKNETYTLVPIEKITVGKDSVVINEYFGVEGIEGPRTAYAFTDLGISGDVQKTIEKNFVVKKTFWLGTDRFGRDMLSRMILGARVSLAVGFISVFISLLIGIVLGLLAGYYRGRTDAVIMWLINVVWSLPTLLMVIAVSVALGKGFWQIFIAVGLTMWVEVARVVRGQVLALREKEFIEATKVLGYSDMRIIFRHILPNVTGPVIVISAANFASAILLEAGLSFLGIGVQQPIPSWGMMIKDHFGSIVMEETAYLAIVPGLAIMLLVMAFNFVGNGLRDALDVRMG